MPLLRRKVRLRKMPAKAQAVVFPLILSFAMSGIVSSIATLRAVGLGSGALPKILQSWGMSYAVAFPMALVVMPLVRRLVALAVKSPPR